MMSEDSKDYKGKEFKYEGEKRCNGETKWSEEYKSNVKTSQVFNFVLCSKEN